MYKIDENRGYWLIRTEGGKYYEEFVAEGFVAIGWNEVADLNEIKRAREDITVKERILETIKKLRDPDNPEQTISRPGLVFNQIDRFINDIKPGDVVLIPSKDSLLVDFGIVQSEAYIEKVNLDELEEERCPFIKRRRIKWVLRENRHRLDPYLFQLLNSHYAVSRAHYYAPYIDRTLNSFFVKGNQGHLVIRVRKKEKIYAHQLIHLINLLLSLVDLYNEATKSTIDKNDIEIKINVQSPGPIEFIAPMLTIAIIGYGLAIFVLGGRLKTPFFEIEFPEGLADKIMKFGDWYYEHRSNIQVAQKAREIEAALHALEAKIPPELSVVSPEEIEEN
ncbi:MAG: restriction system protein [Moorella sp. (in: firmicutes)]|nr:restriction system protein [Moorella sp. (in: firmicutes)]